MNPDDGYRISIDRRRIAQNLRQKTALPVICVELGDGYVYAASVDILGPSRVVYDPCQHDPDDRLASAWIEVGAGVGIVISL